MKKKVITEELLLLSKNCSPENFAYYRSKYYESVTYEVELDQEVADNFESIIKPWTYDRHTPSLLALAVRKLFTELEKERRTQKGNSLFLSKYSAISEEIKVKTKQAVCDHNRFEIKEIIKPEYNRYSTRELIRRRMTENYKLCPFK